MPSKRPAKGGREGPDSGKDDRTDEDILKERRRLEVFALADYALGALGWGAWLLAGAWFLCFNEAAPTISEAPESLLGATSICMSDPTWLLVVSGCFITNIGRSSPKSAWSWWRKPWHVAWCVVLALMALCFGSLGMAASGAAKKGLPTTAARMISFACGGGAVGMAMTCPSGPPNPCKSSMPAYGKSVLMVAGLFGFKLGFDGIVGAHWSEPCGPAAAAVSALLPLMLSSATVFAGTDAELCASAYAGVLLCLGAILKAFVVLGNPTGAMIPGVSLAVLLSLFVPIPGQEEDANPFYMSICKAQQNFKKMMSQPISGFGDDE